MGDRRSATMAAVLFTDLVRSTDLLAGMGQDRFRSFMKDHFGRLRPAIEQHRGTEIKTLGDGVLATFPSATDAVACAVAMQRAVARRSRLGEASGSIRVGLALGEVTVEDGDVLGTPVVEAARLVAVAEADQILATDLVRRVCDQPWRGSFRDAGQRELKGLPRSIPVVEVHWEPTEVSPVPMPALLTDMGPVFVGRSAELDQLRATWDEVDASEPALALLAGEPGVGKTRLAAEVAALAHEQGATVLAGRCDEDLRVPYQLFVEALRHFVDHSPDESLPEQLGRFAGELVRLVPELATRIPGLPPPLQSDPETEQYRLFDAVAAWLEAASADRRLLLVLDDLQWAAKPSLLLLRHLLRTGARGRVLVLATYRDTDLTHDHPLVALLADFRRHPRVRRLSLAGLVEAEVVDFVERSAGHELPVEAVALARAIHSETQGNPFFLREVLRHLVEVGALVGNGDRWEVPQPIEEVGIPEGVREVVGRRLSRLSAEANTVLRLAAVAGVDFELAVLHAAGDLDEEGMLAGIEEALGARLLMESSAAPARCRFAHSLVRETVYGELSAGRRAVLHHRVGTALETVHRARLDDHLPALAHHYAQASASIAPGIGSKAVAYARRAGERASREMAYDEAASFYRQALELLDLAEGRGDDRDRLDLLRLLGEAQRHAGDPSYRDTLLTACRLARDLGDAEALAQAALANHRGVWSVVGGVDDERVAMLESALEALGPGDSPTRARVLANLAVELVYGRDPERRYVLSGAALAMSRRLGEPRPLADVLRCRVVAIWGPATVRERLALTEELLRLAHELGDSVLVCAGSWHRFVAALEAGEVSVADRCLDASERLAEELGQPTMRWLTMILRACRLLVAGEVDHSLAVSRQALELGRAGGQPDAELYHAVHAFNACFDRGNLEAVADDVVRVAEASPGVRSLQATVALVYVELGRFDDARSWYDRLLDELAELRQEAYWMRTVTQAAYVCHRLGDVSGAPRLLALLAPFAAQAVCTGLSWGGSVSYYMGLLEATSGRLEEAEASLARSEAAHRAVPAPCWVSRSQLARARVLSARGGPGDAERAAQLRDQARETARALGLGAVERETDWALGQV